MSGSGMRRRSRRDSKRYSKRSEVVVAYLFVDGVVRDPSPVEGHAPAVLAEPRELEVVLLARHAGDHAAEAGSAAEVLTDPGNHRRHPAGRVVVAERRQHGEEDVAALGEGVVGDQQVARTPTHRKSRLRAHSLPLEPTLRG